VLAPSAGYFGPPTSSVDWCEANYRFTPYVCELFNTLSSVAMIGVGIVGLVRYRKTLELRFLLAFFAISVVGLGSTLFHATLRFELQLLDEIPMLYLALVMVFILLELEPGRRFGRWLPLALAAHGALVTALAACTRGRVQFFAFHLSFGSLEVFALYRVFRLYRTSESPSVRRSFRLGLLTYVAAVALWFVDLKCCHFVGVTLPSLGIPNPELHAVWHVLVSFGFYVLVATIADVRVASLRASAASARSAVSNRVHE
jgi:dihydroceramidase